MRKIMFVSIPLLVLCFLLYGTLTSHSQASNDSYEFEYYYNENEDPDGGTADMEENRIPAEEKSSVITAREIDTTPDSITVFVNKEYPLPADYQPEDLVVPDILFNFNYFSEKKLMRSEASDAIERLFKASEKAGLTLCAISGYRSYERQRQIYEKNLRTKGAEQTNLVSAVPGYSEHQTGLAMDVSTFSVSNRLEEVFAGTPEGKWLAKHAHEFGFIIRYPREKCRLTGYAYEPWHIRYVGKALATILYNNDMCLEEYFHYKPDGDLLHTSGFGRKTDVEDKQPPAAAPVPSDKKPAATAAPPANTLSPEETKPPKNTAETEPEPSKAPDVFASPESTPSPELEGGPTPVPSTVPEPDNSQVPEETQNPIDIENSDTPAAPAGSPDAPPEATEGNSL